MQLYLDYLNSGSSWIKTSVAPKGRGRRQNRPESIHPSIHACWMRGWTDEWITFKILNLKTLGMSLCCQSSIICQHVPKPARSPHESCERSFLPIQTPRIKRLYAVTTQCTDGLKAKIKNPPSSPRWMDDFDGKMLSIAIKSVWRWTSLPQRGSNADKLKEIETVRTFLFLKLEI